jgi:hypothetical protein
MRCQFKAVAVFVVLCLTPTSYARYYDPEYGRFLSRDEMEGKANDAPSLNRYVYAHDNPVRYTDSTGRCPNCVAAGVGAVIGGLVGFGVGYFSEGGSLKKGLAYGGAGAVFGGLAGFTAGASIAAASAGGAVTAETASAGLYMWGAKAAGGAVVDLGLQRAEYSAGMRKDVDWGRTAMAAALGTVGAPGVSGAAPGLARGLAATLGPVGVVAGYQTFQEGVQEENPVKALVGMVYGGGGAGAIGGALARPAPPTAYVVDESVSAPGTELPSQERVAPPSPAAFTRARGGVVGPDVSSAPSEPVLSGSVSSPEPTSAEPSSSGAQTYEILSGVRRAKSQLMVGKETVPAVIVGQGPEVVQIPIEDLRSPRKFIDAVGPTNQKRWFDNLGPASEGSAPPPLEVSPGPRGTPIKDVPVIFSKKDLKGYE